MSILYSLFLVVDAFLCIVVILYFELMVLNLNIHHWNDHFSSCDLRVLQAKNRHEIQLDDLIEEKNDDEKRILTDSSKGTREELGLLCLSACLWLFVRWQISTIFVMFIYHRNRIICREWSVTYRQYTSITCPTAMFFDVIRWKPTGFSIQCSFPPTTISRRLS